MRRLVALVAVSLLAQAANCAPFINLDFELGSTNSSDIEISRVSVGLAPKTLTFGTGPLSDLLPGWRVLIGGQETNLAAVGSGYYNWPGPAMPAYAALLNRGRLLLGPVRSRRATF